MWNETLQAALDDAWLGFVPPERLPPSQWCERYRFLSEKSSEMSGQFSWTMVPFLPGVIDALFEDGVKGLRCMKSAQVGWSESIFANLLGYFIAVIPAPIIVLFPKLDKAKEFNLERFEPMIEASPVLAERVPIKSREKGITQTFKSFIGGWLKFVGSHSADSVKSSSARYVFVEEPDDCEKDVKGQGSTIKLLRERLKTYFDTLSIMGGTPTLKTLSAIEAEMELTDKRLYHVPCHHCGDARPLVWENVKWTSDPEVRHPVYGSAIPETARYACAACGGLWTDSEKNYNVRRAADPAMRGQWGWIATAPFTGIVGVHINDLMSAFPGARLDLLVTKYLEALHAASQGDNKALVEFYNNQLGLPFEYKSPAPEADELEKRSEDYAEMTVPRGGLRLTAGVDVQGNRLAITIIAWGRGEESWRVYWGEIFGNPVDPNDETWRELESILFRPYRHASGARLHIEASSVDASDGNTNDAVYQFCRKWKARGVLAVKGRDVGEIFTAPKPIDPNSKSKASKYGLQVYNVGTEKAKDLIIGFGEHGGRLQLKGDGPGRMHWYRNIRGDYFVQVTSEIKAPQKGRPRNKLYWQVKQGVRNEALDCEVYALHAARKLRINLMSEAQWAALDLRMRQPDLIAAAVVDEPIPADAAETSAAEVDADDDVDANTPTATQTEPPPAETPRPELVLETYAPPPSPRDLLMQSLKQRMKGGATKPADESRFM